MKLKHFAATLAACLCVLLGIVTITKYGVHADGLPSVSAQSDSNAQVEFVPAKPATAKAAKASIVSQLTAFKNDDYQKATIYQSKALRLDFGSTDTFRQIMKMHYPEFANYKSVTFGPIEASEDKTMVEAPVKLVGSDGETVSAIYLMILENGIYRVEGVEGGASQHPVTMPSNPSVT